MVEEVEPLSMQQQLVMFPTEFFVCEVTILVSLRIISLPPTTLKSWVTGSTAANMWYMITPFFLGV